MVLTILIPILGAIGLATGTIIQRTVLRKRKINTKLYMSSEFLAIVIAMLPFIYFFWKLDPAAFETKNIIIFALIIVLSIIANRLLYYSMKWEKVSNLEPAKILEPLFVVLLAIFFSILVDPVLYEAKLHVIIPAIIAGLALIFSHIRKHHLKFNRYFLAAIIGSFLFALELVISRLILDYYSPISFYFLRCLVILIISLIIFRPKFGGLNTRVRWEMIGIGFLWAFYRVVIYYGYLKFGVVFTTLMVMLGPIFVYLFAWKFLKEKIDWRNIVAALIIIASVIYAVLG